MEGQWNVNENELAEIKAIAGSNLDTPVLMININKYNKIINNVYGIIRILFYI